MKKINIIIGILITFLVLSFMGKDAKAQTLPDWCFHYTSQDGIEENSDQDWWWWAGGAAIIGQSSFNHSGTGSIRMSFSTSEANGSYIIADRYVDYLTLINTSLNKRSTRLGCGRGNTQPLFPNLSKTLKFCSASIWVFPSALRGVKGSLQLLSADYYYLANVDFNFPNSTTGQWQKVIIPSTTNCETSMIVRIGMEKTSTSIAAIFDDLEIIWTY